MQLCKDLKNLQQELNNSQKEYSAMLKEQDWLRDKLKSVNKRLILKQFKLSANDLALKDLYTELQTERSKKIELFSSLDEATK